MRKNCRTEYRRSASGRPIYKLPMSQSEHPHAVAKRGYVSWFYSKYLNMKFRARHGFMLETGVFPTKPLQTASAATPLPPDRRTPKKKPVEATQTTPLLPPEQPSKAIPDFPEARTRRHTTIGTDDPGEDKSLSRIRRKRTQRYFMPLQPRLFAGLFTAILVIGASVAWWLETPDNVMIAQAALPASAKQQAAGTGTSGQSGSGTKPHIYGTEGAHATGNGKEILQKQPAAETRQTQAIPFSEHQSEPHSLPVDGARRATAGIPTLPEPEQQADAGESRRASQQSIAASENEPAEEINRSKVETPSKTRTDRVVTARSARMPSTPASRPNNPATKKTSGKASRSVKHASVAQQFNQCRQKPSFFGREKCKWQVCGGRWGENGCPSYTHDVVSY